MVTENFQEILTMDLHVYGPSGEGRIAGWGAVCGGFAGERGQAVRALCLCGVVLAFLMGPSFAEETVNETIASRPVVIEAKAEDGIVVGGKRYRVEAWTTVLDAAGNGITLCDLALPCEARIEYNPLDNRDPVCLRIEVIRMLEPPNGFVIADDPG